MFAKWKKTIAVTAGLTLLWTMFGFNGAQAAAADTTAQSALYDELLDTEGAWIAGLQFDSGAVPTYSAPLETYNNEYRVVPYFTHFGLMGLLERPQYALVVKRYMDWYFAHLNRQETATTPIGSVYDYWVGTDKQTETSVNDFDSTDSYASTFLGVLRKYAETTGDSAYLLAHKQDILLIAGAMLSTQQSDGLTWAKPSYKVKYLMDNSEVYKGLDDLVWICSNVFADETAAGLYRQHKTEVYNAIQNDLWLSDKNVYSTAKMEDGSLLNPDWNTFYADATAQLFPIWSGILEPGSERALHLYNTFNEHHPGWPQLQKGDDFPWALIAYTASIMGDRVRVDQFLQSVKSAYADQNHPWPWYVLESGVTMLTAAQMKKLPVQPVSWQMDNLQDGDALTSMPFTVQGTAEGIAEVEMRWTHEVTQQTQSFKASIADGKWEIPLDGLTNGQYTVDVAARDSFNNVLVDRQLEVGVKVGDSGDMIEKAVVQADRSLLHRGESAELAVKALTESGTPADLQDAVIDYRLDRPDMASIDADGKLTLLGLAPDLQQIRVWAFVTEGNNVVKTDTLAISVSHDALTMYDDVMDRLSQWLSARQLEDGAITLDAAGREIVPSAASIGALGMLLRPETIPNAERYVDWAMAHWNWGDKYGIYGTLYDYSLNAETGQWSPTGTYDSSSPNIAALISLLRAVYETTGQFKPTQYNLDIMTGGLGIMHAQDTDGLMWRLPDEPIKRFYDNAITYKGMADSVWLFEHRFESPGPAAYFANFADALHQGIQRELWNPGEGWYYAQMNQQQEKTSPDLTNKEQAVQQLAAIIDGVVPASGDQAKALYEAFNQRFAGWSDRDPLSGTDASIAYAAALMGDKARVNAYLGRFLDALKMGLQPADLNVAQAGYLMLAADLVKKLPSGVTIALEKPEQGAVADGVSQAVKGEASGANQVKVSWFERFGEDQGSAVADVLPNGKWIVSMKGLKRGAEYEIAAAALDARGYQIPGSAQTVRITIENPSQK